MLRRYCVGIPIRYTAGTAPVTPPMLTVSEFFSKCQRSGVLAMDEGTGELRINPEKLQFSNMIQPCVLRDGLQQIDKYR